METTMACMERVFEYAAFGGSKHSALMVPLYEGTNVSEALLVPYSRYQVEMRIDGPKYDRVAVVIFAPPLPPGSPVL